MPATGLKIVGTGACLPWCSISSSFQNSLKTSGHRGYEFLEFLYIPFSIHSAFQNMQAAHTICTYVPPYHQRCWLLNWTLITRWKVSLLLARRTRRPWFPTRMSNLDSSDHRTLSHFETVHFKWALAHRTRRRFWAMFIYGFLFAW